MQTASSLNAAFERNVTVDIIRKIILEVDNRFLEQQNILRLSYTQLCGRLDQLRCKVQILASTTGANTDHDYMTVSPTAHNTSTPNANTTSQHECRTPQNSAGVMPVMDAPTTNTGDAVYVGAVTPSSSGIRNRFHMSYPTDHPDLATSVESSTPKAFASMRPIHQANLTSTQALQETGNSMMSAHRTTPSASTPFFATSHTLTSHHTTANSTSIPTHEAEMDRNNSAGGQGIATFAMTAKINSVAAGAADTAGALSPSEMSRMRMNAPVSSMANTPAATSETGHLYPAPPGGVDGGLTGTATPPGKYVMVDPATGYDGLTSRNSAPSPMKCATGNSDWGALTLGAPNSADSPLMASPQASGKLSLDDLLARFSHADQSGNSFNFDSLYEQLTGVKDDATLDPSRTIDMGGSSVGVSDSAAAESTLAMSQQQQQQLMQQQQQQQQLQPLPLSQPRQSPLSKQQALCPTTASRASDVIPIDMLRALHDQHLTTTMRAVYENGRPTVVRTASTPHDAGCPTAATEFDHLRVNTKTGSQVLVEFKRKRVLQFESDGFVPPGQFVMVGGDRGEDLGLVIYTWAEVISKEERTDESNTSADQPPSRRVFTPSSENAASVATAMAMPREAECGSNEGSCATVSSGNRIAGGAKEELVRSTIAASVMGIGLTGSTLIRSIGVGNGTVLRLASEADVQQLHTTQAELERRAVDVCTQRVLEHRLPMTILDAEYQFDKKKLTFFYDAQQRLDFRELVRDLYKTFRARIWMELVEN